MLIIAALLAFLLSAASANAGELQCGQPPSGTDEHLKGEIEGKAQFLSRFVGDASLAGRVETSKEEIFFKYPNADRTMTKAFFQYQMCEYLKNDKTHTYFEKFQYLMQIEEGLSDKQSSIEDEFRSKDPGVHAAVLRKAFQAVHVFTVVLTPLDQASTGRVGFFESMISSPVDSYSVDTGEFSGKTGLCGSISGDAISFTRSACSGSLKNISGTWGFKGPVSCAAGQGRFSAEFSLR